MGPADHPSWRHAEERAFYGTPEGRAALGAAVQDALDAWRAQDVAAELARRGARRGGSTGLIRTASSGSEDAGWFDAPRSSRAPSLAGAAEEEPLVQASSSAAQPDGSAAAGWLALSTADLPV